MSTAKGFFGRWKKPIIAAGTLSSILLVIWSIWYTRTDLPEAAAMTSQRVIL